MGPDYKGPYKGPTIYNMGPAKKLTDADVVARKKVKNCKLLVGMFQAI